MRVAARLRLHAVEHRGVAKQRVAARATVLTAAYAIHPEQFPAGLPHSLPARHVEVWINPPRISAPLQSSAIPSSPLARAGVFA
jgi:hypothetical protein